MSILSSRTAPLLAAGLLAAIAGSAAADELIVMPYSCAIIGGEPVLTPSSDQGHLVLGPREQRTYTACSPVNPEMCRRWTIFRFDVDCGGVRVPWMSVAAAADRLRGPRGRRAWVENGAFHLPMPAAWNLAPDDPCARWSDFDQNWRYRRYGRYCADRRDLGPPASVEMPSGFAPMLGLDGIFVPAPPRSVPPSVSSVPSPTPSASAASAKTARAESPRPAEPPARVTSTLPQEKAKEAPPRTQPPQRVESASPPGPAAAPTAPTTSASAAPPTPASAPPASAPPASAAPAAPAPPPAPAVTTGAPVIPKVINRSEPETGEIRIAQAAVPLASRPPVTASPEAAPVAAQSSVSAPKSGSEPLPAKGPQTKAPPSDGTIAVSLVGTIRSPTAAMMMLAGGLLTLLLAAFAVLRWRERADVAAPAARDFASVSLDAGSGSASRDVAAGTRREVAVRPQVSVPQAVQAGSTNVVAAWDNRVPRNRSEALEVLGMGVASEASEVALKKIVDGLRLSWHPDQARDASDRKLRELRMKQINAAWEIIAGRRAEA